MRWQKNAPKARCHEIPSTYLLGNSSSRIFRQRDGVVVGTGVPVDGSYLRRGRSVAEESRSSARFWAGAPTDRQIRQALEPELPQTCLSTNHARLASTLPTLVDRGADLPQA